MKKFERERVKSNALIKKSTFNLNNIVSQKYGFAPKDIENKSLDKNSGKNIQEIYDFYRLWRVKEANIRNEKYAEKPDVRKKRTLRSPLNIGEKVLVLAERLKKKMHLEDCTKVLQKIDHFLIETEFS